MVKLQARATELTRDKADGAVAEERLKIIIDSLRTLRKKYMHSRRRSLKATAPWSMADFAKATRQRNDVEGYATVRGGKKNWNQLAKS